MSEVVIEGFPVPYTLPEQPKLKDISGYDLPKKQQKWIRPILPNDKEAALLPKEERKALIERELIRRIDGFWFMNNGEPTYITGANYFYLTYWYMNAQTWDKYPEYRNAVREWFYVIDICVKDPNCYGCIMVTNKRFGKSEMAISELYNSARLLDEGCLFGMQAITSTEAKNNLFKSRLMRSHKKIPNYLKPISNETIGKQC